MYPAAFNTLGLKPATRNSPTEKPADFNAAALHPLQRNSLAKTPAARALIKASSEQA